jgi:hypothetical protein
MEGLNAVVDARGAEGPRRERSLHESTIWGIMPAAPLIYVP